MSWYVGPARVYLGDRLVGWAEGFTTAFARFGKTAEDARAAILAFDRDVERCLTPAQRRRRAKRMIREAVAARRARR